MVTLMSSRPAVERYRDMAEPTAQDRDHANLLQWIATLQITLRVLPPEDPQYPAIVAMYTAARRELHDSLS